MIWSSNGHYVSYDDFWNNIRHYARKNKTSKLFPLKRKNDFVTYYAYDQSPRTAYLDRINGIV